MRGSPVEKRKEAGKREETTTIYNFLLSVGAVCQGEHLSIMVWGERKEKKEKHRLKDSLDLLEEHQAAAYRWPNETICKK